MKYIISIALFILLALPAVSQILDETKGLKGQLQLGLSFNTVSYHIYYDKIDNSEELAFAHFSPLSLNIGYNLSERTNVQLGIAYGGSENQYSWVPGTSDTLILNSSGKTNVFALPITVRHTVIKAYKRFPVYATLTVMPAWGSTRTIIEETRHGINSVTVDRRDTGVNTFVTAGFGFNYKISKSINGFFEYHAFKHNLTGENSVFYDWDQGARGLYKFFRTIGFGVNYDLKRKEG